MASGVSAELLAKPVREMTAIDVAAIATGGVIEDAQTEFKEAVPGSGWANNLKLDEKGRDGVLKEIIAFANSFGGTLYVGIEETQNEPKRSSALMPVPRVAQLAAILADAMRDSIEPRLLSPEIAAIITDASAEEGVLVVRVSPSPLAPHWNRLRRECYRRIGGTSQTIGMLDIQGITLDRARSAADIEQLYEQRRHAFEDTWNKYSAARAKTLNIVEWRPGQDIPAGFAVRCSAIPAFPVKIPDITARDDLKIGLGPVLRQDRRALSFVTTTEPPFFRPVLRAWHYDHAVYAGHQFQQLVRGDGVLESVYMCIEEIKEARLPVEYLLTLAFGMIFTVEVFRARTGTMAVPYELELEVRTRGDVDVLYYFHEAQPGALRLLESRTLFPRYLLEGRAHVEAVVKAVQHDLWNAMGRRLDAHIKQVELDLAFMWQVLDHR
jgi:hypothetical protein